MWVSLVENYEYDSPGADYFVQKRIRNLLGRDPEIDTVILGCTHYPLLLPKIRRFVPPGIRILSQGEYVAASLQDYLLRHPGMDSRLTRGSSCRFLTTEQPDRFNESAAVFLSHPVEAERISLE